MCMYTLFLCLCMATGIYQHAYALKMVAAEDVCAQQGLQPGTPEYDACVEQEQKRQAALIQAIMIEERAPVAEPIQTAVEPYDQTIIEPATVAPEATLLPELPIATELTPAEQTPIKPVTQAEPLATEPLLAELTISKPTPAEVPAAEQATTTSLPVIALQQNIATKMKPQATAETTSNECSGQMTHHEFAAVDGCMATVEIDETGDAIEPTVFPRECAPSAEDMRRL